MEIPNWLLWTGGILLFYMAWVHDRNIKKVAEELADHSYRLSELEKGQPETSGILDEDDL